MINIAVIYFSGTGHTHLMAESVGLGGTYAITGGVLVIVALGFAVFKSQVRNLTRARAI